MQKPIEQRVILAVQEALNGTVKDVNQDTRFEEDLGFDSLDVTEVSLHIEDEFEIVIPDDSIAGFKTIGDLIEYVKAST